MGKLIGVFATDISSRVQGNLYQQLHKRTSELGYNLVFFSANLYKLTDNTDPTALGLFEIAEKMDFAAFLVHVQSLKVTNLIDYIIDLGHKKDIPVFVYDCDNYGYTSADEIITINPLYTQGFAESVRHLIEHHGCKNIYMLAGMRDNKYSDDRIAMYKQELESHGQTFDPNHVYYGDFWEVPSIDALNEMLKEADPLPDAICCANDSMAITAVKVLRQHGIRVPDQILVTGFDGIDDAKFNLPTIATCQPDLSGIPDFIIQSIESDKRSGEYLIPIHFFPDESCGCKNSDEHADKTEMVKLMENARQSSWQHGLLSHMQLELMDCCDFEQINSYVVEILNMYRGFSHMFIIRNQLEYQANYPGNFEDMYVVLSKDFTPDTEGKVFDSCEIVPGFEDLFSNAEPKDLFIFYLLQSGAKKYGYHLTRSQKYMSNEVKMFKQLTESYANMLESVLRNKRLDQATKKLSEMYERMSEVYIRDTMTGLYNREGYYQAILEYVARPDLSDGYIHIVAIDMDGMKYINDHFGHQEGDNAIKAVARAINECFAQPCVSARFGGDEFVVALFTESNTKPTSRHLSSRLNNYLKTLSDSMNAGYTVSVSVGHTVGKISEMDNLKLLEKDADEKMYINKRKRKGEQTCLSNKEGYTYVTKGTEFRHVTGRA